jgi:anti-sigma regulatory factor (Ser/Thr protein kinase)
LDPENLLAESGRGIYLVKMLMDGIDFNITENGSEIIIRKNL